MGGEGEHPATEDRDRTLVIDGPKIPEQGLGTSQSLGLGCVEPTDCLQRGEARGLEGEEDLAQVDTMDFGSLAGDAPRMFTLRPEAEADAGGRATGAARALIGGGTTDLLDQEGVDAAARVEARDAGEPAVDHTGDPVDGERGLGHIGGDDDLASSSGGHGGILIGGGEFAVKRHDRHVVRKAYPQSGDGAGDLVGTRHEDEKISRCLGEHGGGRLGREIPRLLITRIAVQVADLHRMGASS